MKKAAAYRLLPAVVVLFLALMAALPSGRAQTLEVLHTFQGGADGTGASALVQGSDGNLYGTTWNGGGYGYGSVFKMTPDDTLTTLVSFNATATNSLVYPSTSLMLAHDGNFYGMAQTTNWATMEVPVFKMTPDGTLTVLAFFGADTACNTCLDLSTNGVGPNWPLTQGPDGNFYGSCWSGNPQLVGTIFRMSPEGTITRLFAFHWQSMGTYGNAPNTGLVLGKDGNFYGTTIADGTYGMGTMFRVTANGVLTILRAFNFSPRARCRALMQASDGSFYGATHAEADTDASGGTVFRITPDGHLTTVISFDDLGYPVGYVTGNQAILQGRDGNIYGVTGRPFDTPGIVWKLTPEGTWTMLGSLASIGANGGQSLIQGADGNLYGTTAGTEPSPGLIFRVVLPSPLTLGIAQTANQVLLTWPTNAAGATLQTSPDLSNWTDSILAPVTIGAQNAVAESISGSAQFYRLKQ